MLDKRVDHEKQNAIIKWIENNPDRWYTTSYDDLVVETGVPKPFLYRCFTQRLSEIANIPPSEIQKWRSEHTGWKARLSNDETERIRKLINEGKSTLDISFMTGRTPRTVNRVRRKMEKERAEGE